MSNQYFQQPSINKHSNAWVGFVVGSFGVSTLLVALGVYNLPVNVWIKGFLAMGILMMVQNAISLTKTIRDIEEGKKIYNKIEDAKNEKLLSDTNKIKI